MEQEMKELASSTLHTIFNEFAVLRESSQDKAYRLLHKGLSENGDLFVAAEILDLPKLIDSLTKLEEFIRAGSTGNEKTPTEAISDWLNSSADELPDSAISV